MGYSFGTFFYLSSVSDSAITSMLKLVFYCQKCSELVSKGIKSIRFVESTRLTRHPYRSKAHRVVYFDDLGKRRVKFIDDPGGLGPQIAGEICVCPKCAHELIAERNSVKNE